MYKNLHIPSLMLAAAAMIIARLYVTAAGDGRFSPASEDQTICFPLDANDKVDFIAYCPQAALTGNTYAVDVTDQSYPAAIRPQILPPPEPRGSGIESRRGRERG